MAKAKAAGAAAATAKRFAGQKVVISGKLKVLRKDDLLAVLKAEGATIQEKPNAETTLTISAANEAEIKKTHILPTAEQVEAMLREKSGRPRLEKLLQLTRKEYSRSTDEGSSVVLKKKSFHKAALNGSSLCGIYFVECDLREADLSNTEWLAYAKKSDFRKSKGKKVALWDLEECDFRDSDFQDIDIRDSKKTTFAGANVSKSLLSDLETCNFDGAKIVGGRSHYGDMTKCSFNKADMQKFSITGVDFFDCQFEGADLRNVVAKVGNSPTLFKNCNFKKADFRNATLSQVIFEKCDLTGANFEGAKMIQVEFKDTDSSKAKGLAAQAEAGAAVQALKTAAPTFKNVTIKVMVKVKGKKTEVTLYQFNHNNNSSDRQAWWGGKDIGSLELADAITTIAKLHPGAKIDEKTLSVKPRPGKVKPKLTPKQFEQTVLAAWQEALG